MNKPIIWTIELPEHGQFSSTDEQVVRNLKESKRYLAQEVAKAYEGSGDLAANKNYWMYYNKQTLAVVLAGMQYPRN